MTADEVAWDEVACDELRAQTQETRPPEVVTLEPQSGMLPRVAAGDLSGGPRDWSDTDWVAHGAQGHRVPSAGPPLFTMSPGAAPGAVRGARRRRVIHSAIRLWLALLAVLVVAGGCWYALPRLGIGGSRRVVQDTGQRVQPVISLLSPQSGADVQRGVMAPLGSPLPGGVGPAPSRYLAPDKPSKYEISLIAAIGTPDKVIVVSKFSQTIHVYDHGRFIAGSYAITGRPQLPTPEGVWHIFLKTAPAVLYSPWPPGSEFYYPPAPVQFTMEFRDGGFLIHDASWHTTWGPGMNDWHYDAGAHEWEWGTHGCVTAPLPFIQWLYNWSPLGTTVIVYQ